MPDGRRAGTLALLVQKYLLTGTKELAFWYKSTNTDTPVANLISATG